MKIVKSDSFRSEGRLINETEDMVRVVIDCTALEFKSLSALTVMNHDKTEALENLMEIETKLSHLSKQVQRIRTLISRNNLEHPLLSPR